MRGNWEKWVGSARPGRHFVGWLPDDGSGETEVAETKSSEDARLLVIVLRHLEAKPCTS